MGKKLAETNMAIAQHDKQLLEHHCHVDEVCLPPMLPLISDQVQHQASFDNWQ